MAKVAISGVLASAFSDLLGTPVVTYDQYKQDEDSGVEYEKLDISHLFRLCYESGTNQDDDETRPPSLRAESGLPSLCKSTAGLSLGPIDVRVETVNHYSYTVRVEGDDTVKKLREKLREKIGMPCEGQRLIFDGRDLDDDDRICDCGITQGSILQMPMTTRNAARRMPTFVLEEETKYRDPQFDFNFTEIKDGDTEFYRGGKRYFRPCGWDRFALKVRGKYENDKWLGKAGHRIQSTDNEWPVSYHGTKKECSDGIVRVGFLTKMGKRHAFGPGIYSSPSIDVAMKYSSPFSHDGKRMRLVFQTRICPQGMRVISEQKTKAGAEYWIQENDNLIRPYGICMQHV